MESKKEFSDAPTFERERETDRQKNKLFFPKTTKKQHEPNATRYQFSPSVFLLINFKSLFSSKPLQNFSFQKKKALQINIKFYKGVNEKHMKFI